MAQSRSADDEKNKNVGIMIRVKDAAGNEYLEDQALRPGSYGVSVEISSEDEVHPQLFVEVALSWYFRDVFGNRSNLDDPKVRHLPHAGARPEKDPKMLPLTALIVPNDPELSKLLFSAYVYAGPQGAHYHLARLIEWSHPIVR